MPFIKRFQYQKTAHTLTEPPPIVASVVPNIGPSDGGTTVTITGSNFHDAFLVNFGPSALDIWASDPFGVVATAPVGWTLRSGTVVTQFLADPVFGKEFTYSSGIGVSRYSWDAFPSTTTDVEILALWDQHGGPSDGNTALVSSVRASADMQSNYSFGVQNISGVFNLVLGRADSGLWITLVTGPTFTPGTTKWWGKLRAVGSKIYVKWWLYGTAEPSAWSAQITDSTYSSGYVGISIGDGSQQGYYFVAGGFTPASFTVVDEHTIIATTSVHPAGTVDVTVTTPFGTSSTGAQDTFTFYDSLPDMYYVRWIDPIRQKVVDAVAIALMVSGLSAPAYTPPPPPQQITNTTLSSQVVFKSYLIYQSHTEPVFVPTVETITPDKWIYPWSEPVRQKIGLRSNLQQAAIGPVLNPDTQVSQDFESRWHQPWSEPLRFKRLPISEYPSFTTDTRTPEFVTPDKWIYPWTDPVRFRAFPTHEQQAYAAPTFTPEFITTDKWIYPWSEPVRQKIGLKTYLQQATIGPVLEPETQITQTYESRWHYPWSEPVRIKPQVPAGEQRFKLQGPVQTPEFITVDKWIYGWSEPVRQKIGLKAHLQQALIAPVLNPDTQISQDFESRWHFPWSEPVRFRTFPTSEQQTLAFQPPSFEILTIDKWGYPWSEPVRQKPGLKVNLQQAFIGLTLEPETQIIQTYESRWHQAWSEPVRVKLSLRTGLQQAQVQGPVRTPEFITVDKWIYPWTDPVRQKIGIRASLQQAFIAPVLADEQLTGTIESRWHQSWSEPVRFRRFPSAEQQSYAAPVFVAETVTADKWIYPWTDPVRQKIGLKTYLQQALIAPVLNPETQLTQDYESRWHQPWSEPVRFRRFATAEQQTYAAPTTSVFEIITVDKWIYRLNEPVRTKIDPKLAVALAAPAAIGPVLNPDRQISQNFESRWHQAWSEPVRFRRFPTAEQQSEIITVPVIEVIRFDKWGFAWSEPVRQKPGLGAWLQQFTTPQTPIFPTGVVRTLNWYSPLNEPVRLKIGLGSHLQREFTTDPFPIENPFSFLLDATEVNADSALFGVTVYNTVPTIVGIATVVVSIEEISNLESPGKATASIAEGDFVPTAVDISAIVTESGIIIITEGGITIVTET